MAFVNATETIGIILSHGTTTTTGSIFLTLMIILLVIMAIAIMFQIRLEYTSILILPYDEFEFQKYPRFVLG